MSRHAALSIGANLGDRLAALQGAVDALAAASGITVTAVSPVFATDPVGGPEQPEYLNAVVLVDTSLEPLELLEAAQRVESQWHRTREVRWGPRTLDVDILVIDDLMSDDLRLTLPHPRAHERAFVIIPWLAVEPDAVIPGHGAIGDLVLDTSGVHPTEHRLSLQ